MSPKSASVLFLFLSPLTRVFTGPPSTSPVKPTINDADSLKAEIDALAATVHAANTKAPPRRPKLTDQNGWIKGRCVGKGSFGTISLAYDKLDVRVFAIKSVPLSPTASPNDHSILGKIAILRPIRSPFIVSFLGNSTTHTHCNLHMEYIPGGTIADSVDCLGKSEVRAYARQIARALFYLHTITEVMHSDVKGRNVLARPSPVAVKLTDFWSAHVVSD